MLKKCGLFVLAFPPLVIVNAYCLAAGYFESGNSQVNTNVFVLFLVVSLLISVSKLFFDFFVTVVTARCAKLEVNNGGVLKILLHAMVPQWAITLLGLMAVRLVFGTDLPMAEMVLFAAAHSLYYGCTAFAQHKKTGRKVFFAVYAAEALVCWVFVITRLLGM